MDQKKIGRLIYEMRKQKNLTQFELANKLGVTDRAISHWENGRRMPDLSLIKPLCDELEITVNDLLSGEIVDKEHRQEKYEENILNTLKILEKKTKQQLQDKRILTIAIVILFVIGTFFSYNEFFSYFTEYLNDKDSEIVQIEYDLNLEDSNWRYTKYERNSIIIPKQFMIHMNNFSIELFDSTSSNVNISVTKNDNFFRLTLPWVKNDERVMIEENIQIKNCDVMIQIIMTSSKLGIHHGLKDNTYLPIYRFVFNQNGIQYQVDIESDTTQFYYSLDEKEIHDNELNSYINYLKEIVNFR